MVRIAVAFRIKAPPGLFPLKFSYAAVIFSEIAGPVAQPLQVVRKNGSPQSG